MDDVLICVDEDHDPDATDGAPVLVADRFAPIWALYTVLEGVSENWYMTEHGRGLTFKQAEDLASELGLVGRRIS